MQWVFSLTSQFAEVLSHVWAKHFAIICDVRLDPKAFDPKI